MYRLENPIGALFFRLRFGKKSAHLARPAGLCSGDLSLVVTAHFIQGALSLRCVAATFPRTVKCSNLQEIMVAPY